MPARMNIWQAVQRLDRLVFTTREIATLAGMTLSSATQGLKRLEGRRIAKRVMRGVWAMAYDSRFSPLLLVPFLSPSHQSYVSFTSALSIYGFVSQIPQVITVASTAHTRKVVTPVATYYIHQLEPRFFTGFDWHQSRNFLIATPEKAVVDCLYISSRRGKQYLAFPEIEFPRGFKRSVAKKWIDTIQNNRLRISVLVKMERLNELQKL